MNTNQGQEGCPLNTRTTRKGNFAFALFGVFGGHSFAGSF